MFFVKVVSYNYGLQFKNGLALAISRLMTSRVLAIVIRAGVAGLVYFKRGEVEEVRRRHFYRRPRGQSRVDYLTTVIGRFIRRHRPTLAVVEPGSLAEIAVTALGLPCIRLPIAEAKAELLGKPGTHASLYRQVLARAPRLTSEVRISSATGEVMSSDCQRSRTVGLLAAAIGLVHHESRVRAAGAGL